MQITKKDGLPEKKESFKEGDIVEDIVNGHVWLLGKGTPANSGSTSFQFMNLYGFKPLPLKWHESGAFPERSYRLYSGSITLSN